MPGTIIIDKDLSSSIKKYLTKSQYSNLYIKSLSLITNNIITFLHINQIKMI